MELNVVIDRITKYLDGETSAPIVVDVPDKFVEQKLINFFKTGANAFVDASDFCVQDGLPQLDKLIDDLQHKKTKVFLSGLSTFLRLEGSEELNKQIHSLMSLEVSGRLVILTFQCDEYLKFTDPRIKSAGRYMAISKTMDQRPPILFFVTPQLANHFDAYIDGINKLPRCVETSISDTIYIKTTKTKDKFPNSLFEIRPFSKAYDVLIAAEMALSAVSYECGTDEQWMDLSDELKKFDGWYDFVGKKFGGAKNLALYISSFNALSEFNKWAYFIAMKSCGVQNNAYLSKVIECSDSLANFFDKLYTCLLKETPKTKLFRELYEERYQILKQIKVPTSVVASFCKQVSTKRLNSIFYLTDATIQEKEAIIEWLATYAGDLDKKEVEFILNIHYPALYSYISKFNYGVPLLDKYFNAYKYNKVINRIPEDFIELMEEQAVKREFNSILPARSALVAKLDKKKSKLYFVDAFGVEFLSYIQNQCYDRQLTMTFQLGRCELPSITSKNKAFVSEFDNKVEILKLDKLKHEGSEKYDYTQTHLPIHIIEEFSIIDKMIENVESDLNKGTVEKIYIISDHGASRLAVIHETENKWEISEKGIHSGRCCPVSDIDGKADEKQT